MITTGFFTKKWRIGIGCWLLAGLCAGQDQGKENIKLSNSLYYFIGKGLQLPLQATTQWFTPGETILTQREKKENTYIEPLHAAKTKAKQVLQTTHQQLTLYPDQLSTTEKDQLLQQVVPFFTSKQSQHLQDKLSRTTALSIDQDLLPTFARTHVKRFPIYRGPNCFHTAIAFSYPDIVDTEFLNPKWEKGYHPHMLNGDEIVRALSLGFYPLHRVQNLQYGDILIFLEKSSTPQIPLHLKIQHAMVYLFSDYVFSKASKSADSPYRIEKLETEWKIWSQLQDLEIKVFRKKPVHGTTLSSFTPYDWRS